mgnify:FL=1
MQRKVETPANGPLPGFLASWLPATEAWERGEKVDRLIGIHAGETRRGRIPDDSKYRYVYPLREWKWGQEECQDAIKRAGLQVPCKSACFFCPARRKPEIIQLAKEHPDLMDRAIAIERQAIATGNLKTVKGLGRNYSWEALLKADNQQQRLFIDCQAPLCDICMDQDEPTVSHVLEVLTNNARD